MKVLTIFGTRPEIIRLSLVMRVLDQHCDHVMTHTGQNYDQTLSDIFFRDLEIRKPDHHLAISSAKFGEQAGQILTRVDEILEEIRPDRLLLLGDTNSALSAIAAARRGIPVYHMEAGNRCFDSRVPEEVNRRIIDHSSTILMPYTERSRANLLSEGIDPQRVFVTGNPIYEVLEHYSEKISASSALDDLQIREFDYFLVTLHRSENVDAPARLERIMKGLVAIGAKYDKDVLISVHPRTQSKLAEFGLEFGGTRLRLMEPLGFFDFVKLEKSALAVLSDSGTVQEECAIFQVPNVTLRDVTERPETVECGSNILSGSDPESMLRSVEIALGQPAAWKPPPEYLVSNVSQTVSKIVLGYLSVRQHSS